MIAELLLIPQNHYRGTRYYVLVQMFVSRLKHVRLFVRICTDILMKCSYSICKYMFQK